MLQLILLLNLLFHPSTQTIELKDALDKKLIAVSFSGAERSTHYHKALKAIIKNNAKNKLDLKISNGWTFQPIDSTFQSFVSTNTELISLQSQATDSIEIYSMCTAAEKKAPNNKTLFKIAKKADEKLVQLTQLIEKNKYFNSQAQSAVWTLSNNRSIMSIDGYEKKCRDSLIQLICQLKKIPIPSEKDWQEQNQNNEPKAKVRGSVTFNLSNAAKVQVALFNNQHVWVHDLYPPSTMSKGTNKINYNFDGAVFTDDYYYSKVIVNDKVLVLDKIKLRRS